MSDILYPMHITEGWFLEHYHLLPRANGQGLTPPEYTFLAHLSRKVLTEKPVIMAQIAQSMGLSVRQLHNIKTGLVAEGLLIVNSGQTNGVGNTYDLTPILNAVLQLTSDKRRVSDLAILTDIVRERMYPESETTIRRSNQTWGKISKRYRSKHNLECRVCSNTNALAVHHIIPWRQFPVSAWNLPESDPKSANFELNLFILCHTCHRRAEGHTEYIWDYMTDDQRHYVLNTTRRLDEEND